ncbi:MAG: DNA-processing protein DprA [Myxococcales bacterium]|nr:DNA-processing protein DprA [Myxococcales bacterium]
MTHLKPLSLDRPEAPTRSASLPVAARLEASGQWPALWIHGDPSALAPPLVALVGTRHPDAYALRFTEQLAADLARANLTVVSGGALGIDAAAHRGALSVKGRTAVVLPAGLDHWYPRRHHALYHAVLEHGGALVSQFEPDTPPKPFTFARRNGLVATLADVVVVVRAPLASGSLQTAAYAQRLGRRLLAVPASPDLKVGLGCVALLRAGATPCYGAEDVLRALASPDGALFAPAPRARSEVRRASRASGRGAGVERAHAKAGGEATPRLDGPEAVVYQNVSKAPRHVDEIARCTGFSAAEVQQCLLSLLLSGLVEDRGGGTFARLGEASVG